MQQLCSTDIVSIPRAFEAARVYGETAVVQGITSLEGTSEGAAFKVDVRFTDTLIKVKGQWMLVVSHVTRIPH